MVFSTGQCAPLVYIAIDKPDVMYIAATIQAYVYVSNARENWQRAHDLVSFRVKTWAKFAHYTVGAI